MIIGTGIDAAVAAGMDGAGELMLETDEQGPVRPKAFQLHQLNEVIHVPGAILDADDFWQIRHSFEDAWPEDNFRYLWDVVEEQRQRQSFDKVFDVRDQFVLRRRHI